VLAEHMLDLFIDPPAAAFMSFTLPTRHRTSIVARPMSMPPVAPTPSCRTGRCTGGSSNRSPADTGSPAVLNTSLNASWEPIVASPERALGFLYSSAADALVINHFVVTEEDR
jgi:hypothetical protein